MFKILIITLFLFSNLLFANENILAYNTYNQTLILPKQSEEAKNKIIELISTAKQSINISMYNFSYKKFAKELVQASKNGVKVKLILDKSKVQNDNEIYKYLKNNGIEIIIPKDKVHTKIAVFDDNILLLGSLNWTKESFENNHEILLISNDKKIINEVNVFINSFN